VSVTSAGQPTDKRLVSGFQWLVDTVVEQYDQLSERVTEDVKLRREREARDRRDRAERVRKIRQERYERHTIVSSHSVFHSRLKTHLFSRSFPP